jgi:uncharacterized RDD family membrane protein YckC
MDMKGMIMMNVSHVHRDGLKIQLKLLALVLLAIIVLPVHLLLLLNACNWVGRVCKGHISIKYSINIMYSVSIRYMG